MLGKFCEFFSDKMAIMKNYLKLLLCELSL